MLDTNGADKQLKTIYPSIMLSCLAITNANNFPKLKMKNNTWAWEAGVLNFKAPSGCFFILIWLPQTTNWDECLADDIINS